MQGRWEKPIVPPPSQQNDKDLTGPNHFTGTKGPSPKPGWRTPVCSEPMSGLGPWDHAPSLLSNGKAKAFRLLIREKGVQNSTPPPLKGLLKHWILVFNGSPFTHGTQDPRLEKLPPLTRLSKGLSAFLMGYSRGGAFCSFSLHSHGFADPFWI